MGAGALRTILRAKYASVAAVLVPAVDPMSLHGHPGSNSATGPEGFGAAGGVGSEHAVQILSRLLAIDRGEAMSGVGADEEIGKHPD